MTLQYLKQLKKLVIELEANQKPKKPELKKEIALSSGSFYFTPKTPLELIKEIKKGYKVKKRENEKLKDRIINYES